MRKPVQASLPMTDVEEIQPVAPRVVGRYALFDEIAAGGMATVHFGRLVGPVGFSRTVAIKRLHPQFSKDEEFVSMFLDEAKLASRIQHPNVVSTLDVVSMKGELFVVMEYVQGEPLSKLVRGAAKRKERMPVGVVASIMAGTLHGLHAAHEATSEQREPLNIVHRDVSPQNVLVGTDGVARVLDFGIAKAALRSQSTQEGQMKGKLSYMSPEQLNGEKVDRRTDIFAAGVVLWEALLGKRLFAGNDAGEILSKVLTLPIPRPTDVPGKREGGGPPPRPISRAISDVVMKALERDPAHRFQTAREFAVALENAGELASHHKVGTWVEENAGDGLVRRVRLLQVIEALNVDLASLARIAAVGPLPPPTVAIDEVTGSTSHAGNLAVAPSERARGGGKKVALGVVAATVLIAGTVGVTELVRKQNNAESAASPAPSAFPLAPAPVQPAKAPPQLAPELPSAQAKPAPAPAPEPVKAVETKPAREEAPAPSVEAAPTAVPEPQKTAPAAEPATIAPATVVPPATPTPKPTIQRAPTRSKDACSVPYTIDSRGIRRLKPECL